MSEARSAQEFFDGYADDFDAIYGGKRSFLGRILDRIFRRSMLLRYQHSVAGCMPVEGRTVLDVGCGPGHYCVTLARAGAKKAVGIDPAEGMLDLARRHAEAAGVTDRCEFVKVLLEEFDPPEPFDFSIVMGVMDYVREAESFAARVLELTRGKAFFSFPADGGILAANRKRRYRNRTPLYMYRPAELKEIFDRLAPGRYTIRKLARDYFVEVRPAEAPS